MPRQLGSWLGVVAGLLLPATGAAGQVEVGAKAPPFRLQGTDGAEYSLSDYVGKRGVVMAWFPRAFTPG